MKAILDTCGPVTVHVVIVRNYKHLAKSSPSQFLEAATTLQELNLGSVVQVGTRSQVFIKKPPDEAMPILQANLQLCAPGHYVERYRKTVSKSVGLLIRQRLASKHLVPSKLLK